MPDGDANDAPHPVAYLTLAVALAFVAGCVDAIGFGRVFDVFPANQSGNAVVLGIALGHGDWGGAWRPAVAIVGFGLGVALAIVLGSRVPRRRRPELLVALEILLLGPMAVVVLQDAHPRGAARRRRVRPVGARDRVGDGHPDRGDRAGRGDCRRDHLSDRRDHTHRRSRRTTCGARGPPPRGRARLAILVFVLVAYVGGAAAGAGMGAWRGALLVPIAILAASTLLLAGTSPHVPGSAVTDA